MKYHVMVDGRTAARNELLRYWCQPASAYRVRGCLCSREIKMYEQSRQFHWNYYLRTPALQVHGWMYPVFKKKKMFKNMLRLYYNQWHTAYLNIVSKFISLLCNVLVGGFTCFYLQTCYFNLFPNCFAIPQCSKVT